MSAPAEAGQRPVSTPVFRFKLNKLSAYGALNSLIVSRIIFLLINPLFLMFTNKQKRKKTVRACTHCHRAHLLCDENRPCARCVQKGLQATCQDAPRKRKKYLLDVPPDSMQQQRYQSPEIKPEYPMNTLLPLPGQQIQRKSNFLSSAADMEYSTLSNILLENVHPFPNPSTSNEGTPNSITLSPALSPGTGGRTSTTYTAPTDIACDNALNQYVLGPTTTGILLYPDVVMAIETLKNTHPSVIHERNTRLTVSYAMGFMPDGNPHVSLPGGDYALVYAEPEDIYAKVRKPYSYTPGYHALIAYLRSRFPKQMLVKMAESMAAYRPSFIACTNALKEDDLIFMEQCFQRTLLTYDNFIKLSGTPTIVWRRTGEIAYVGDEFCVLTGWPKAELITQKKRLIVELLDDKSVVEYFELFLKIAFGDFLGATMTECTLLTSKPDVKIRTSCIWTLKRDVFGIPMMIIGNFLPI